jgi:hypothetical protein
MFENRNLLVPSTPHSKLQICTLRNSRDMSFFGRQVKLFEVDFFATGHQLTCLTFEDKSTKRRQVKKIGCNQSFLKRRQLTYL